MVYVEPFFGSGAIGWEILAGLKDGTKVVLNDCDVWLMQLWRAVKEAPDELITKIRGAQVSSALFSEYKATDGSDDYDFVEAGFRKLMLHQMSFSGLGAKAGGPIGGREQDNRKYNVGSRWNYIEQERRVRERHLLLSRFNVVISWLDFEEVITKHDSRWTFFYCDPPYCDKGGELYKYSFSNEDHARLANKLKTIRGKFVLSYDDAVLVRDYYAGFNIIETDAIYSICGSRKNHELIIKNFI